jgi:hypothetical protein
VAASYAQQIAKLTKDSWQGTAAMIEKVMAESSHARRWTPTRSAVLATTVANRVLWMTPAQFNDFLLAQDFLAKKKGTPKPVDALGLKAVKMDYLRGARAVTKVHALAMAHFAAGLPMPIEPENTEAFDQWFTERFGQAAPVTAFLDVSQSYITDRLRGFDITTKGRAVRLPSAALIRALDWVLRFGPFCPYGEPVELFTFPTGLER